MIMLIGSIFIASLLGSLHCAGMCGAFVAIAMGQLGPQQGPRVAHWMLQGAYHGGRLLTYTLLGVVAGTMGQLLDIASALAGIQPIAMAVAGATLLAFGVVSLMQLYGVNLARLGAPGFLVRWVQGFHRRAMTRPPLARALMIGLFTTLLPCGWLYMFAVTAASTASWWKGAMVMAIFWAGTLPILVSIGAGARAMTGTLGRKLPALTCVLLIVVGSLTLMKRWNLDPNNVMARASSRTGGPASQPAVPSSTQPKPCCSQHER